MIIVSLTALLILASVSCKKDPGRLPDISFKTGVGYISSDATVARNTAFKIGINAAKTEDNDILKIFNISVSYDGGASSTLYTETLTAAQEDNYSYDLIRNTRNQAGTEKYTFTITNRDGLINAISLTLTAP
ncbi:MAG TPA: hypothetical protein VN958_15600 [Chitinophagaceae bacterium]|nr:hypothetical protein [Chitinophagaceae bacterium]